MGRLIDFLTKKMSMTEIYQPVILKELLANDGVCTKEHLARKLAEYDLSVKEYYKKVVMRWPKITLTKHQIISYKRKTGTFHLQLEISSSEKKEAIQICELKIEEWIKKQGDLEQSPTTNESVRYRVLKRAKGKCELCGIPSSLRPIDIDHIVPQSKADKYGKIKKDGKKIDVNSEENLQALCFKCNRAKRAGDDTDFRRTKKLVRDKIPEIIRDSGRNPIISELKGTRLIAALNEKLIEEHEEYIQDHSVEELSDLVEVAFTIAKLKGVSEKHFFQLIQAKRKERGGFSNGIYLEGYS